MHRTQRSVVLRQDYAGPFSVIIVDDDSNDGTAAVAAVAAEAVPQRALTVVRTTGPPRGWTGKLWAVKQGIDAAERSHPEYLLLTDADIVHARDTLSWLVRQSVAGGFVLTSLMAKLRCVSLAERSHVPAFIYFFQMLFPFSSRSPCRLQRCGSRRRMHAHSRGCSCKCRGHREHPQRIDRRLFIGGNLKTIGPIWLGLTDRVQSIRPYRHSAGCQADDFAICLCTTSLLAVALAATTASMAVTFIAPLLLAIFATGLPRFLGFDCLACDGIVSSYRRCGSIGCHPLGAWPCRDCVALHVLHSQFRVSAFAADGAASGRGAFKRMRRACNDPQRRIAIRQRFA